jgi:hypothetical protein
MSIFIENDPKESSYLPFLICDYCDEKIENVKTAMVIYPNEKGAQSPQFVHAYCIPEEDLGSPDMASCDLEGFFTRLDRNADLENCFASNPELN